MVAESDTVEVLLLPIELNDFFRILFLFTLTALLEEGVVQTLID